MSDYKSTIKVDYLQDSRVAIIDSESNLNTSTVTTNELLNVKKININGDGSNFLSDDGTYKEITPLTGDYLPLAGGKVTGDIYLDNTQGQSTDSNKLLFSKNGVNYAGISANTSNQLVMGNYNSSGVLDSTTSIYYDIANTSLLAGLQNETFKIGSLSNPINAVYAQNFQGNLTGNADTATTATNATTATKLQTTRTVSLTGDATASSGFNGTADLKLSTTVTKMAMTDDRDVKPADTGKRKFTSYFASKAGLTGTGTTGPYVDLLVCNGYIDDTGGKVNALAFNKTTKQILHYQADQDDTTWGTPSQLAYTTSNVASATQVKVTDTSPTTSTSYRMVFSSATGTGNTDLRINNNDTSLIMLEGTASALGYNILTLGNATGSGTAGNKQGKLRVYSTGTGYNELVSATSDTNYVNTLPASTGTLINSNGGTLTGKLIASQGVRVATLSGGAGTAGWMKVCTITIGNTYQNQYIVIGFVQRARFGKLYIGFSSVNSLTPSISKFYKSGLSIQARIVKTGDSVWDLYIAKQEAYDNIEIVEFYKGQYMEKTTVKWIGTSSASLPDTTQFPTYADATNWNITVDNYKSYALPLTGGTLSGNLYFNHISGNNSGVIGWNTGTIQQRLVIDDNSTTGDNVFTFQQSTNSGTNWTSLLVINDDSSIETQRLISSIKTGTYLAGSQGKAIINSMSSSGSYTTIFKTNSTNGKFTMSNYQTNLLVGYQSNSSVNAGTNALTKQITLLNESGNSTFPGIVYCTGGLSVQGHRVFVQSGTPSGAKTGDVWIDIP